MIKTTLPAEPFEDINDWYKYIYASLGYKVGEQTTQNPIQNTTKNKQNESCEITHQPIQQPSKEGSNKEDGQESN